MEEIAAVVKKVVPNADIELGPPGKEVEIRRQSMDRIKDEFGFIPKTVKEGIEAYVTFLREGNY
jgi:hypothetical protein